MGKGREGEGVGGEVRRGDWENEKQRAIFVGLLDVNKVSTKACPS